MNRFYTTWMCWILKMLEIIVLLFEIFVFYLIPHSVSQIDDKKHRPKINFDDINVLLRGGWPRVDP